jgi:hypothetical protein
MMVNIRSAVATALIAMAALSFISATAKGAEPVELAVRFKLTDPDYKPIGGADVRLVLGAESGWQNAAAGKRFITDPNGVHHFQERVILEQSSRKRPTNFVDSLFSRAEPTDHLQVAAELEFAGHRWLYVVDIHRFKRDGDLLLAGLDVYAADASGGFTRKAKATDAGWTMADMGGLVLTDPGHKAWEFRLQPDATDSTQKRWTLEIGFMRSPEPVRR